MRVVAIGECMVELAPTGDGTFTMGFAGDTFNTAWYLRRLMPKASTVSYLSAVGTDHISDRMVEFLAAEGIAIDHLQRLPERSVGLYMIQLAKGERSFSYWRSTSAARLLAEDPTQLNAALDGADLIYLSGITLAILSEGARLRLLSALALARAAGSRVAFDPNINWNQVAADYFASYLQYNPTDAKVVQMLGTTYLYSLKNCAEGIKQFEHLIQLDPSDCIAKRSLGYAYFAGGEVGCPKNLSRSLDYLLDAYNCVSKSGGACKDPSLVLWVAQAYHTRGAERAKDDKTGSKADFKNAFDWYGKVLQCQPGNKDAQKGQDDTRYEF